MLMCGAAAGWVGPSLLTGSAGATNETTDLTASLAEGGYQIGTNGYDTTQGTSGGEVRSRGFPQVTLYRDATFALSYGQGWDVWGRLTRREDRAGLPFASPVAFGAQGATGQYDGAIISYDAGLPIPLVTSLTAPRPGGYENATFGYNNELDLTGAGGWRPGFGAEATYAYTRDAGGRPTRVDRSYARGENAGFLFNGPPSTYAYLPNGKIANLTNVDGSHDFAYDARGLVQSITVSRGGVAEGAYTFGYDALGRNTALTYPDGHQRVQQYDAEGRITSRCYTYTAAATRCYTADYDAVGNPTRLTDPEGSDAVEYDALDRVGRVTRGTGVEDYAYNALGALRVNAGNALELRRARLDGAGLGESAVPAGATMDPGGRITALNGVTLAWNARGRVTQAVAGGVTVKYGYDAYFRRIARVGSDGSAEYGVYEGENVVGVLDGSAGVKETYLFDGVDHPLRMRRGGSVYYYEVDLAGNVRRLRGPGGADLGGYRYTAFGVQYAADAGTPAVGVEQPLRWKGRPRDAATGLVDMRARWWWAEGGVFVNVDEFAYHDARSTLWGWPGQNALKYWDPTGHDWSLDPLQWDAATQAWFMRAGAAVPGILDAAVAASALSGQEELVPIFEAGLIGLSAIDAAFAIDNATSGLLDGQPFDEMSKTGRKSNDSRVEAARADYEAAKREHDALDMKPKKVPADKEKLEQLKKAMNKALDRMRKSEEHAKRGQGCR